MNNSERIQMILEAIRLVEQARDIVRDAVIGTDQEPHYERYGEYGFDQLLNKGNPYDPGLNDLIDELQ